MGRGRRGEGADEGADVPEPTAMTVIRVVVRAPSSGPAAAMGDIGQRRAYEAVGESNEHRACYGEMAQ